MIVYRYRRPDKVPYNSIIADGLEITVGDNGTAYLWMRETGGAWVSHDGLEEAIKSAILKKHQSGNNKNPEKAGSDPEKSGEGFAATQPASPSVFTHQVYFA